MMETFHETRHAALQYNGRATSDFNFRSLVAGALPSPQKEYKPTRLSFMIGYPDAPTIGWPDYITFCGIRASVL